MGLFTSFNVNTPTWGRWMNDISDTNSALIPADDLLTSSKQHHKVRTSTNPSAATTPYTSSWWFQSYPRENLQPFDSQNTPVKLWLQTSTPTYMFIEPLEYHQLLCHNPIEKFSRPNAKNTVTGDYIHIFQVASSPWQKRYQNNFHNKLRHSQNGRFLFCWRHFQMHFIVICILISIQIYLHFVPTSPLSDSRIDSGNGLAPKS